MQTMHTRRTGLAASVLATGAFWLGGVAPAAAQSNDLGSSRVIPGWVLTPAVAFGAVYDDNPALASEGNPASDDTITNVTPGLDLSFTAKHTFLEGGYRGTLMRYRTLDEYDSYDQRGHLELRHQPSERLRIRVRNVFSVSPTSDAVEDATGVVAARADTRQNTFTAGANMDLSPRLVLSAAYDYQWLDFQSSGTSYSALLQGGRAHGVTFGVRNRWRPHWTVGADYSVQRATVGDFADELGQEQFTTQSAMGVVIWQAMPTVEVQGSLGLSYLFLSDPNGSRVGPAASIGVRKQTEYALFHVRAQRAWVPAFGFGGSLQNQQVTAGMHVPFARRRAFVQTRLLWRESEPVLDPGVRLASLLTETTLGYALQRWLRVETFYSRVLQDSVLVPGGRVTRNRFGVRIVTAQAMRLH
jgi:hypothetical protein